MPRKHNTALFLRSVASGTQSECWPFTGPLFWDGYGKYSGRLAHRVAFEIANGSIPPGLVVMHICDNKPCCNPAHLQLGTAKENSQDCVRKGRCARPFAKITREQTRYVITMRGMGYTNGEIAPMFGIKKHAVSMILARDRKRSYH